MFDEDELICERCSGHMTVGYGMEPTRHCHACAHEIAEREPLTDDRIQAIHDETMGNLSNPREAHIWAFARAIEAAHGISAIPEE